MTQSLLPNIPSQSPIERLPLVQEWIVTQMRTALRSVKNILARGLKGRSAHYRTQKNVFVVVSVEEPYWPRYIDTADTRVQTIRMDSLLGQCPLMVITLLFDSIAAQFEK